jgi:hypothetical protein
MYHTIKKDITIMEYGLVASIVLGYSAPTGQSYCVLRRREGNCGREAYATAIYWKWVRSQAKRPIASDSTDLECTHQELSMYIYSRSPWVLESPENLPVSI